MEQLNYWHWYRMPSLPTSRRPSSWTSAREIPRLRPIAEGPFCEWRILHLIPTILISKSLNHYQAYWFHGENKYNWGASQSFGFSIWMRTTISTAKPNLCQQRNTKFQVWYSLIGENRAETLSALFRALPLSSVAKHHLEVNVASLSPFHQLHAFKILRNVYGARRRGRSSSQTGSQWKKRGR